MNEMFDTTIEEKSLDITAMKCEHAIACYADQCAILLEEMEDSSYLIEGALEDVAKKAVSLMEKLLEELKKFFDKLYTYVHTKAQQFELNKKLDELKDIMAKKKAKALGTKASLIDIAKYKKFYTDFINRYTKEVIEGLHKDFKDVKEYEKWRADMMNKLNDFNFKLSDEEQWKLSVSINSALELTEKEAANREKNLKMVEEEGNRSIKQLEGYYKKLDNERSFVNYNKGNFKIFSLQNSFIGFVCSKIAQAIKTVANFIAKHPFVCVTFLLTLLIAV